MSETGPIAGPRDAWGVFGLVTAASIALTGGSLRSADYVVAFSVAANLVESGSLEATPVSGFEAWAVSTGRDGRPYCRYGLAHSLPGVPAAVLGRLAASTGQDPGPVLDLPIVRFDPRGPREVWQGFFASQTNAFVLGALASAVLHLATLLGMPRRRALFAALLATLGSPLLFQASDFTAEPLSALALVLAGVGLARLERSPDRLGTSAAIGLAVGGSALVKVAQGVLLVPGALAVLLAVPSGASRSARRSAAVGYAAGALVPLAALAAYNALRFGDPFETGYGVYATEFTNPFWEGLLGQLFSPGRGLFFYFPAGILAIAGMGSLYRVSRGLAAWTAGSFLALWLLYSGWFAWDGGWTYGPRLLSPILGLWAVAAMRPAPPANPVLRTAGWIAILASFLASWLGFLVDYVDYGFYLWREYGDRSAFRARWSLWDAPLVAYWGFPLRRGLALLSAIRAGGPSILIGWFAAAGLAGIAGGLLLARRRG